MATSAHPASSACATTRRRRTCTVEVVAHGRQCEAATRTARRRSRRPAIDIEAVLEQLGQKADRFVLEGDGRKVSVDQPRQAALAGVGEPRPLTKRDLLVYFARVSPYLLPHMRDRPITLTRYPNGIDDPHFYQKHCERHAEVRRDGHRLVGPARDRSASTSSATTCRRCSGSASSPTSSSTPGTRAVDPEPDAVHLPTTSPAARGGIRCVAC